MIEQTATERKLQAMTRYCAQCRAMVVMRDGTCPRPHLFNRDAETGEVPKQLREAGTLSTSDMIQLLNSLGLKARRQWINEHGMEPLGRRRKVPHSIECPTCQRDSTVGRLAIVSVDGQKKFELLCQDCIVARDAHVTIITRLVNVSSNAWRMELV